MNNSSLRVDLSHFFNDARRHALIFIDETWININDVQDHIQKLFRLTNISLMTKDGCFVPPKESIKVLKSLEWVKAFKLNAGDITDKDLSDASALLSKSSNGKKRKNRSAESEVQFSSSTPYPKRSKSKNSSKDDELSEACSIGPKTITVVDENLSDEAAMEMTSRPSVVPDNPEDATVDEEIAMETSRQSVVPDNPEVATVDNNPSEGIALETTRRRSVVPDVIFHCPLDKVDSNLGRIFRLPQKNKPVQILENILIVEPSSCVLPAVRQENGQCMIEPLEAQPATAKGVKEAEVPNEQNPSTTLPPPRSETSKVEEECEELDDEPGPSKEPSKVEECEVLDDELELPEEPSKVEEQSLLESDSDDDVVVLEDTTMDCSNSTDIINDLLQTAAPLTDLPNVGETIIFKLSSTKNSSENSPKTAYIAGSCSYINRRTKSITIVVIAYGAVSRHILRQYMSSLDDSIDSETILNVNFKQLMDAKVVVSAVD